jgi:UDP-N-acetylglucosamine 2-epimerase (non-hydrolysing)
MSTVLGALAARRRGIPVFHVESGLTSGKLFDPFPEELSRRIVFRLTDVALCPSASAAALMARYSCRSVDTGGNTIEDAVLLALRDRTSPSSDGGRPYLVASLHRFQNIFDSQRFSSLIDLLEQLAKHFRIHFVLHPATRKRLQAGGHLARLEAASGVSLTPRLGYRDFLTLAAGAACVLTDGGSNQEELAVLGVPTIIMRKHTERADGIGANAIMEGDVPGELADYLRDGGYQALRRAPTLRTAMGPSERVAEELAR